MYAFTSLFYRRSASDDVELLLLIRTQMFLRDSSYNAASIGRIFRAQHTVMADHGVFVFFFVVALRLRRCLFNGLVSIISSP